MAYVGNLHEDQGYFRFFIMAQVGNLDICLEGYFSLFFITDPMAIIIRVVRLMAGCL